MVCDIYMQALCLGVQRWAGLIICSMIVHAQSQIERLYLREQCTCSAIVRAIYRISNKKVTKRVTTDLSLK